MEFPTLREAHSGGDAAYFGENPNWRIALAVPYGATTLDRANFDALYRILTQEASSVDWHIERSGHWVLRWVDFLVVRPCSMAETVARQRLEALRDYPVLDDELFAQYEHDAAEGLWQVFSLRERIQELAAQGDSIFAARCEGAEELYRRAERTYYSLRV